MWSYTGQILEDDVVIEGETQAGEASFALCSYGAGSEEVMLLKMMIDTVGRGSGPTSTGHSDRADTIPTRWPTTLR